MKRRQTLGILTESHSQNAFSSSVGGKAGRSNRLSMVPQSTRQSDARMSLSFSQNNRRSSVISRPSLISATPAPRDQKDPRPVRDKQFQLTSIRNIINFLTHQGYPQPLSLKTLQTPTKKDFETIFRFLYAKLDPHYMFQKKFEEEVPAILKGLRYPFSDQISKSQLYAVGSMHSWPAILAMLTWLMELVLMCEQMEPGTGFDEGMDNDMLFFDYLTKAYQGFLAGDDDFGIMEAELATNFERKNEVVLKDVERLTGEIEQLDKEIKEYTENEPPLVTLDRQKQVLMSDNEKFQQYISRLQSKKSKLEEANSKLTAELEEQVRQLEQLNSEKLSLQAQIDAQDISPADFDRMTSEREQLTKALETLQQKIDEISKQMWDKEINVQKKLDQIEKLVQDYNTTAYKLGLLPAETSIYADGVKVELEFNLHANRPDQMVSVDLRNVVKPFLLKLRSKFNSQVHKYQDEHLLLQEALDKLYETLHDKTEELKSLEAKISKSVGLYNEEKEAILKENDQSNAEMENLENELNKMRTECTTGLLASQQKAQKITIEYDNLLRKSHETKERAGKELIKILEDCITFKTHIEGCLAEVEKAAMEEFVASGGAGMELESENATEDNAMEADS
ncbi:HEC/Ndc80p family-domain-containing protein [Paraphysoderma sedebokerense]|nr:HEC/Ndc80p family-domain-containing protein [Paraphysoderma sedebokerense]